MLFFGFVVPGFQKYWFCLGFPLFSVSASSESDFIQIYPSGQPSPTYHFLNKSLTKHAQSGAPGHQVQNPIQTQNRPYPIQADPTQGISDSKPEWIKANAICIQVNPANSQAKGNPKGRALKTNRIQLAHKKIWCDNESGVQFTLEGKYHASKTT